MAIMSPTLCPRVSWTGFARRSQYCLTPSWCANCEGLADARAGRVFSAEQIAADLAARRAAGE
jgi:hypothetical protein